MPKPIPKSQQPRPVPQGRQPTRFRSPVYFVSDANQSAQEVWEDSDRYRDRAAYLRAVAEALESMAMEAE